MRPYVYLAAAATIDGRIASKTGYSRLSCPHDLRRLHALRAAVDAVIVGANTAIVDNPRLTVRYVEGRNPLRVLIDGSLKAPTDLRMFDSSSPTIVFTTRKAPPEKAAELKARGVEVYVAEGDQVDPAEVLNVLYQRGVRKALLEGGGRTNWEFLSKCLVDEIVLTVTPYVFGSGVSLVEGAGFPTKEDAPFTLTLTSIKLCECGQEVVLTYRVRCKQ
ncbi:2,5-diamino-6-(ribosylamino)-4(3H)-pyrimidinone 5'-phosphate reductase [Pyrobaculum neutrophilum]|uniref:2,5-diamino-6-(ribosylamino)-4(3H)-pyrimidinone 5'-phosphate reductase n=1 Tax=Pyrobaculum neutrophilum (strain DSM 2338 / JCM 9278 / NBRC 100436 / V24Sta) TaxID=444157 RepID=B1YAW0_PYRNV|nr:2,5-diamino-6-(ribosylamino)-4(3H)-pyrimidinone 5'-phosphate reductase [Pyrobaculum neutrophilum]ACB40660.1 2,5-diamino-6-hydroxy-4-(5-phosphoribosylamino)pyrimidine 1-reductase [Pyrobaculum neutrophilum V24Sta]